MLSPLTKLAAGAAAFAMCFSPTMAAAATSSAAQPVSPLVAVSAFGTQASAQTVYSQSASAATAAGAAAAAAAQDAPPPAEGDFGINWILLGLGLIFFFGGIYTLFQDDNGGDNNIPISPA